MVSQDEVRRLLGELDDEKVADILKLGPTLQELELAASASMAGPTACSRVGIIYRARRQGSWKSSCPTKKRSSRIAVRPSAKSMKLSFHGAASTVTGSCHLLEANGRRVLVDCGVFQGGRELHEENASDFGFDPAKIDIVCLTHAHLDHCGRLPLVANEDSAAR